MQNDDIKEQIEALRQEVRGLSTSILNLRQDDMRKVFGDQIRPVLMDRIGRHYSSSVKGTKRIKGEAPEKEVRDLVDRSVSIFQTDGKQRALKFMDELEEEFVGNAPGTDDGDHQFEIQIIGQIREYFMISDVVFNQTVPDMPSPDRSGISPEAVERLLAPLSNAKRVQVMLVLSREESSLAELSRELDLKKGHLQFHIRALVNADYIRFDRKSRLYSITTRGSQVLEGIRRMLETVSV